MCYFLFFLSFLSHLRFTLVSAAAECFFFVLFFFTPHVHFDSVRENPDNISHLIVTRTDRNIDVCSTLFLFFSLSAYSELRSFIWTLECSCQNISVSPVVMKASHSAVKALIKVFLLPLRAVSVVIVKKPKWLWRLWIVNINPKRR